MQRQCEERILVYTYLDPSFYLAHRFLACVGLVHADDEVYELHRISLSLHLNRNNYFCDERQNAAGARTAISDEDVKFKMPLSHTRCSHHTEHRCYSSLECPI
jgi:hypothetical protein